ncbi:DNA repair protein RecN [Legionella israelensis]|uniref:DNA repair protein RecN n=1 Tax=Legionella israelensis TaxID=454 RepID=UPI001180E595|nr:DNA repair protein RecN [Legionella israelensis]QDP71638.1 DNA repair protein RecN [Legionella israelensis]
MLTHLRIENFAIVKELELDFAEGMTAFTGETGAGKSIMIDALMLALGGRADSSVIRNGEHRCNITACFLVEADTEPALWLTRHDLGVEEGEVILRRVLYAEGRSKSTINGQPFPLQKVKELSEMLVHIHGQHQHQTLMQHATHRQQLDRYAQHEHLLAEVQHLYKNCTGIKQEIEHLQHSGPSSERCELLQFQIDEFISLHVQENELNALHEEHQILHHAKDYLQRSQDILTLLSGEESLNLTSGLSQILHLLKDLPQELSSVKNANELINSALIQCEEAIDEIQRLSEQIQLDPERLQEVESRMGTLHQAARKYHIDAHKIPEHVAQLQKELEELQGTETRLKQLLKQYEQELDRYQQTAMKLRASRQHFAKKLAEEISTHIQKLGMPKGYVEIEFTPLDKMQSHGLDKIEYKVCTNPGASPDALAKIASGGELSRISLAIQMITAQRGATPTLLFDEVDVGIGGATAALVGQLLRKLGQRLQVFCVTHQAQVASAAHHHFMVEKRNENQQTYSKIISLPESERIKEIARMLGGLTITEQTLSHARELIAESA